MVLGKKKADARHLRKGSRVNVRLNPMGKVVEDKADFLQHHAGFRQTALVSDLFRSFFRAWKILDSLRWIASDNRCRAILRNGTDFVTPVEKKFRWSCKMVLISLGGYVHA